MKNLLIIAALLVSTTAFADVFGPQNIGQGSGGGSPNCQSSGTCQSQGAYANANNNSNGQQATQSVVGSTFYYDAKDIPVASAVAPNIYPTAPCMGSRSGAVQGMSIGISLGSTWQDDECTFRETLRTVSTVLGQPDVAARMMYNHSEAYRKALEDNQKVKETK